MTRTRLLAILCILEVAFATAAFGKSRHSAAPPAQHATQVKRVPIWSRSETGSVRSAEPEQHQVGLACSTGSTGPILAHDPASRERSTRAHSCPTSIGRA